MSGIDVNVKRFVRYFYDPPPKNDSLSGEPIWCLGQEYTSGPVIKQEVGQDDVVEVSSVTESHTTASEVSAPKSSPPSSEASGPAAVKDTDDMSIIDAQTAGESLSEDGWPSVFLDDFESRIWMTYRAGFPAIPKSQDPSATSSMTFSVRLRNLGETQGFTSDTGWGCMIRSGQSLLANALVLFRLGREWRRGQSPSAESNIVSMFADDPQAPFSIHRFVQHGASACGKHPGQWFGPSATASCIRELSSECASVGLNVYITNDSSDVYEDRFRSISCASGTMKSTLILLGTRLGIDRVTPVYWEALKATLQYPQSIGIAGGRPSSSHYFVATQGSSLFYLDPHETKPYLPYRSPATDDSSIYSSEELSTVHTRRLRAIHLTEMDPSMLIGFLIRDENDWNDWKRRLSEVKGKGIIHVIAEEPKSTGEGERDEAVDEVLSFDEDGDEDDATEVGD